MSSSSCSILRRACAVSSIWATETHTLGSAERVRTPFLLYCNLQVLNAKEQMIIKWMVAAFRELNLLDEVSYNGVNLLQNQLLSRLYLTWRRSFNFGRYLYLCSFGYVLITVTLLFHGCLLETQCASASSEHRKNSQLQKHGAHKHIRRWTRSR